MGDNIYLGDRNGVRTPMQWTGDRNAGFSRADPARLYAPADHGPGLRLPGDQRRGAGALAVLAANWMKRMIALRKQLHVFGRGTIEFLPAQNRKVLAYVRQLRGRDDPVRRQPVAHRAAGRARPVAVRGHDAGRDARPDRVPAHRRAAVLPHARRRTRSTGSGCSRRRRRSRARVAPGTGRRASRRRRRCSWASPGTRCSTATSAR